MTEPEITEINIKGTNLFRVLNPGAAESKIVPNFVPVELIKNTTLDLENPDFRIDVPGKDVVIFSRKPKSKL